MIARKHSTPARRLSKDDWLVSAKKMLVRSGIDNVKVDALAKRTGASRGSFYWHFRNRQELLDALLRDWEVRNHIEVSTIRDHWKREEPEFTEVAVVWLRLDPGFLDFDVAIRGWARRTPSIADTVRRVDLAWISLLEHIFLKAGYNKEDSLVRARITYFHQIGYHALSIKETPEQRIKLVPAYYRALMGKEPPPQFADELKQFLPNARRRRLRT